jgi:hypothetical protein
MGGFVGMNELYEKSAKLKELAVLARKDNKEVNFEN